MNHNFKPDIMKTTIAHFKHFHLKKYVSILFILTSLLVQSQNYSGLQNKDLVKIDDVAGLLSDIVSDFKGKIDGVTVLHDSERSLKIKITYSGTDKGYLFTRVLNRNKKSQSLIPKIDLKLDGKTSPQELEFLMSDSAPENTELSSSFLEIKISESKNAFIKKTF